MDPYARGLFMGFTAGHSRGDFVRAVMEGVALACYDAYSVLSEIGARPEQIIVAGGGARSRVWRQIMADVFDLPVLPLEVDEQAALGAILLAGSGVGLFETVETSQAWARYGRPFEPHSKRHAVYKELLSIFRDAYTKHRVDFKRLKRIGDTSFLTNPILK
jgi:xylulokinase